MWYGMGMVYTQSLPLCSVCVLLYSINLIIQQKYKLCNGETRSIKTQFNVNRVDFSLK